MSERAKRAVFIGNAEIMRTVRASLTEHRLRQAKEFFGGFRARDVAWLREREGAEELAGEMKMVARELETLALAIGGEA